MINDLSRERASPVRTNGIRGGEILKKRFDRFAVVHRWNFADPAQSNFHVEGLKVQGAQIPDSIEETLRDDLFVPEDFEALVLDAAKDNAPLGKLLREFQEPRPAGQDSIPWLGETLMKERVVCLCAQGKIAINNRGLETLQRGSSAASAACTLSRRVAASEL